MRFVTANRTIILIGRNNRVTDNSTSRMRSGELCWTTVAAVAHATCAWVDDVRALSEPLTDAQVRVLSRNGVGTAGDRLPLAARVPANSTLIPHIAGQLYVSLHRRGSGRHEGRQRAATAGRRGPMYDVRIASAGPSAVPVFS